MNINNLQILLQEAIDNSTTSIDQLLLARAIESLNMGQVRTVATYANLPSASTNEGLLVFVTADERLYWSNGTGWYSIVSDNKGVTYAWGLNSSGQLGDNTAVNKSSPVSVVGGFTDWCQVSANVFNTFAIRTNGTAWSWGRNFNGHLGDGTTVSRSSPVSVVGGFTDWCQVSAGNDHSLGLRTNGTAWAWGDNDRGKLGNNTTVDRCSPVSVVGGFTDWCQVSGGNVHSLGLRTNCTLWAWGWNYCGALGDGTVTSRLSPVSVVGGFTDWCQVAAGYCHGLAIRTNGTLWAWGRNPGGAIGDDTVVDKSSPVSVVGGFTDWCQVAASNGRSVGLRANGTLWAWGANSSGQLGDNTAVNKSSPVSVVGGFTDWCQVSAGGFNTFAVRTNGTLWGWGCNGNGQLGDGTVIGKCSPVSVIGGFTDWCQVSNGQQTAIAIRKSNFV